MKIIILGAGQVGGSLAAQLASEANDITVIEPLREYEAGFFISPLLQTHNFLRFDLSLET